MGYQLKIYTLQFESIYFIIQGMIKRNIIHKIEKSLKTVPVIGLLGPRQVGKTTLAKKIQKNSRKKVVYLDLELPSDLNKLADPELYLKRYENDLVVIDEIQRMPSLFPLIRALVDQNRIAGRFLILGSASPSLIKRASESLAGRVAYHELTPFTLSEVGYDKVQQLWLRGGYPESFLSDNDSNSYTWRENFIKTYLEMDIPQLGIQIPSMQLRKFWTMLSHYDGQLWNASQIALSLGISAPTVRNYLDILEETFIVRRLPPFFSNLKKRLIKSPKVYIRDTGLLHALLRSKNLEDLQGHPGIGSSWEGFIIEQILQLIPNNWQAFFYRTNAGAEIDLLLLNDKSEVFAIEVKYSASPKLLKGFWSAFEDLGCLKGCVVYPGNEKYPISDNVFALPAKNLSLITKLMS